MTKVTIPQEVDFEHIKSLEQLHLLFFNARLRKRKSISIHPDEFERFEKAIKAVLPPVDFQAHGFASGDSSGKTIFENK